MKKMHVKLTVWSLFICLLFCTNFSVPDVYGEQPALIFKNTGMPADTARSGSFSVITYNIAGLPQVISSARSPRSESTVSIGRKLNAYDIVHVQEDFNYNNRLYSQANRHPYRSKTKGAVLFGDGLNTLSRYPVTDLRRVAWNHCTGADCYTPKGFSYSRIEVRHGIFVDFYNVHANAFNHKPAAAARRENLRQLSAYISAHSRGMAVIVMGDLNAHYSFSGDNVQELIEDNKLRDVWVDLKCNKKYPFGEAAMPASDIMSLTDTCETIDKILYRGSTQISLSAASYQFEKLLFQNEKGQPLSDHHPVSAVFRWTLPASPVLLTRN